MKVKIHEVISKIASTSMSRKDNKFTKKHQKYIQNLSKIEQTSALKTLLEGSWKALGGSWEPLGEVLGGSWGLLGPKTLQEWIFGPNLAQLGPNMAPTWPNLAPTWPNLAPTGPKLTKKSIIWPLVGKFAEIAKKLKNH